MKWIFQHAAVARWLLCLAAMVQPACLIPTALVDEPTVENSRPVFSSSDPAFGPMPVTVGQKLALNLSAQDPNPDPQLNELYIRLFKLGQTGPTSRIYTQHEGTLTYPAGTDIVHNPLTPLTGSFFPTTGLDICSNFNNGDELFVVVADRTFSNDTGKENTAPGGLTSENHWELSCK